MPKKGKVNISILDQSKKNTIWKMDLIAGKGLNQLRWDLVIERQHSDRPYFRRYQKYIKPGIYGLQLQTDNKTMQKKLTVKNYY